MRWYCHELCVYTCKIYHIWYLLFMPVVQLTLWPSNEG